MNEEENKNQDSKMNELMEGLKMQSERIIDEIERNGDEVCALIIIGTESRTMSTMYSKGSYKLALAMANTIYRTPGLKDIMKAAIKAADKVEQECVVNHRETADEDETV